MEEACAYAEDRMMRNTYVSLGGFGGYIVVGFDHSIDASGGYDLAIVGNSFEGSSEPGIVWVMQDINGNGEPDDEWYELAGSEYHKPETRHGFQITYTRPAADKMPTPDDNSPITDTTYILWETGDGEKGYIAKKRLPQPGLLSCVDCRRPVAVQRDASGRQRRGRKRWKRLLLCPLRLRMGYVDNHPNSEEDKISFDIGWGGGQLGGIPSTCPVWTSSAYIPVSTNNAVGWGRLPPN